MACSMIAVLMCTLMVSSMLENLPLTRAQDDLAGEQEQALGQYQQEEAQEIQFNMQMQKLQAEGKLGDKASDAQIGSRRRLVQDLGYVSKTSMSVLQYSCQQILYVMSYGVSVSTHLVSYHVCI
jgi:hypothetical protein